MVKKIINNNSKHLQLYLNYIIYLFIYLNETNDRRSAFARSAMDKLLHVPLAYYGPCSLKVHVTWEK